MVRVSHRTIAGLTAVLLALATAGSVRAQGAGSTGATVLGLLAGGRASALSGAYTGATDDADVLFYNPAGIAGLLRGASLSYQRHVEDIGLATGAGAVRLGPLVVGASAIFLDYGEIREFEPDPNFGGQTGRPTGRTVSASEIAGRVSAATAAMDGRLNLGASLGFISTDLAGASRGAPFLDLGAQYAISSVTLGASLRNVGGAISGAGLAEADMPTEARLGGMLRMTRPTGLGAVASADLVLELNGGTSGVVAGIEAGLLPDATTGLGAVGRVGYNAGTGDGGQGSLLLGGGVSLGPVAVDYAYQNWDLFGALHRVGVRWAVRR